MSGEPKPRMIAERYEVRDRIGRGAFGEVFEVYDHRLHRLVALKTLPIAASVQGEVAEELRRFHQEARSVARLSHPGIVTVHDFGETPDFAWIAMELVIGETLKDVLDRGERPSLAETVRVTCALLDALHYAHGRGIVHRDVKPANVLLAVGAAEGLGEVRLADFGIARIGGTDQTAAGEVLGTPVAMSPEQVRGETADLRSDLWSVGVILYQLLTGLRPFPGGMPSIFHSILAGTPKPPSLVAPELPFALDEVVARALAKDPRDRYPDATAMAAALRAAAQPAPIWDMLRAPEPVAAPAAAAEAPRPRSGGAWRVALGFAAGTFFGGIVTLALVKQANVLEEAAATLSAALVGTEDAEGETGAPPPAAAQIPSLTPAAPGPLAMGPEAPEPPAGEQPTVPRPESSGEAPEVPPGESLPAAPPEPRPPAAERAETPPCPADRLNVRSGTHDGFGRIVFEGAAVARYELRPEGRFAHLRFPGAACQPAIGRIALPRNVRGLRLEEEAGGLEIETAAGTRLRHYRLDRNRVVIDVLDGEE